MWRAVLTWRDVLTRCPILTWLSAALWPSLEMSADELDRWGAAEATANDGRPAENGSVQADGHNTSTSRQAAAEAHEAHRRAEGHGANHHAADGPATIRQPHTNGHAGSGAADHGAAGEGGGPGANRHVVTRRPADGGGESGWDGGCESGWDGGGESGWASPFWRAAQDLGGESGSVSVTPASEGTMAGWKTPQRQLILSYLSGHPNP